MKVLVVLAAALAIGAYHGVNAFSAPLELHHQLHGRQHLAPSSRWSISNILGLSSRRTSFHLRSTERGDELVDPYTSPQLDTDAIIKYFTAGAVELSLFAGCFQVIDIALAHVNLSPSSIPFPAIAFLFYASSLKSRVFNPLNNQRPNRTEALKGVSSAGFRDRVMPSWTPPGVIFPIMWILIIGPIRAYSSALVVSSTGAFFNPAIMAFILHLTVGDIWNTINNTEKRYGAAVFGVICVVLSATNAAYQYSLVDPLAGKLLGGTLIWLVTAAALITDTWRLNPVNGKKVPLFPVLGESETSFMWFSGTSSGEETQQ